MRRNSSPCRRPRIARRSRRYARSRREIGERLRALEPDLWILFANDHAEQFFHNGAALHHPCRRRGAGRVRGPQVPLEDSRRDRPCPGARTLPPGLRSRLHQHGEVRLRHGDPAHPSRPYRRGAADLRQRLPAAAADHGALLRLRPGGGAGRDGAGAQDGGARERRHVAFPRHRPLRRARAGLGQGVLARLADRQSQIAHRLQRGRARRHRQHRAALLGLRRRRARRAQARHRADGPELAPRLRVARLVRRRAARRQRRTTPRSSRSWWR